ncbi:hypothetical protein HDU97_000493 [Phlyctochytrium planicorne]|nr:hypothetical protein HDU97_000493 [Phlyctochytrium planicorne]
MSLVLQELGEEIGTHLTPSPTDALRVGHALDLSRVRTLLRLSATCRFHRSAVLQWNNVWRIQWEQLFDPCYDGAVYFPSLVHPNAPLSPQHTLPSNVYIERIEERYNALKLLGSGFPKRLDSSSSRTISRIEKAFNALADMCREGVQKNRSIIGRSLDAKAFYKYFELANSRYNLSEYEGSPVTKYAKWPVHIDFFQVLAHYMSFDNENVAKLDEILIKQPRHSFTQWLEGDEMNIPAPWWSPLVAYLQVCRSFIQIRDKIPRFAPPSPINIPALLLSGHPDQWPRRFFPGTFVGLRFRNREPVSESWSFRLGPDPPGHEANHPFFGLVCTGISDPKVKHDLLWVRDPAFGEVYTLLSEFGIHGWAIHMTYGVVMWRWNKG